jgi:hypothetical protein
VPILSPEQQDAARGMDRFALLRELTGYVTNLEDCLSNLELGSPQLFEAKSVSFRDAIRAIAVTAERIELAIWTDDTHAWALADSIRMRTVLLWDEWEPAKGEKCLWLAQERAKPTGRKLRAIWQLCELLYIEITLCSQRSLSGSAFAVSRELPARRPELMAP